MTLAFERPDVSLYLGDCRAIMAELPAESVDAIVTDPPYGLEFMGKEWDKPWARSAGAGGTSGGFGPVEMADGATRLKRPAYMSSTNPSCRECGGSRRGSQEREAKGRKACHCERPEFPNVAAIRGRAFQEWAEQWAVAALRLLKPGAHLVAFGGTRTYHRLTCAIEDAGFEIRDCLMWLYGQGFSKGGLLGNKAGLDWCECGNAIQYSHDDDMRGMRQGNHKTPVSSAPSQGADLFEAMQREDAGGRAGEALVQGAIRLDGGVSTVIRGKNVGQEQSGMEGRELHRTGEGLPHGTDADASEGAPERLCVGAHPSGREGARPPAARRGGGSPQEPQAGGQPAEEPGSIREPRGTLDAGALLDGGRCARCGKLAKEFEGYSVTLKPAYEPIILARKPLGEATVAANVIRYGTGALNIDGCRIGSGGQLKWDQPRDMGYHGGSDAGPQSAAQAQLGRWPANLALSHSPGCELVGTKRVKTGQITKPYDRENVGGFSGPMPKTASTVDHADADGLETVEAWACVPECAVRLLDAQSGELTSGQFSGKKSGVRVNVYGQLGAGTFAPGFGDTGGASRFFFTAKADKVDRDGSKHPTIKPLDLMKWLVRLIAPPGALILDPFMGSGSTVAAARALGGYRIIGIDQDPASVEDAIRRLRQEVLAL